MEAKSYFLGRLRETFLGPQSSPEEVVQSCARLVESVLSCKLCYFPLSFDREAEDGTEDLCVIFQRLARHDRGARPRQIAGVDIGESDLVRSLLLGSFRCEADAVEMYQEHWLCLERAAQSTATAANQPNEVGAYLDSMLHEFIQTEVSASMSSGKKAVLHMDGQCEEDLERPCKRVKLSPKQQGLHARFCDLLENDFSGGVSEVGEGIGSAGAIRVEQSARKTLEKLSAFADSRS